MFDSRNQQLEVLQPSSSVVGNRTIHLGHVVVGGITVWRGRDGGREGVCEG